MPPNPPAAADAGTRPPRLVLVRDARWPQGPGVCCWRHGVREAFRAAGATTVEIAWPPEGDPPGGAAPDADGLADADVVIAETPEVAAAAVHAGADGQRIYALALPPEPLYLGVGSSYGDQVAGVAPQIAGFLTDSDLAREWVEQAAAGSRPWVEVFPPLAHDRSCPACADAPRGARDRPGRHGESGGRAGRAGVEPHPHAVQLERWRRLLDGMPEDSGGSAPAYSSGVARLRGLAGPWAPARRPGWLPGSVTSPLELPAARPPPDWSGRAQEETAARILARVVSPVPVPFRPPRAVLVAGYNLKFVVELAGKLGRRADLDVVLDEWPAESQPSERTGNLLDAAESIFAEWVRPSAVWLSEHKRPGQFLAIRLHRYELDSPHPHKINIDNVDAVVYVSSIFGRRVRDELGWPESKLVCIPNFLDATWFDRPKLPDARFGLGMVGVESARKRLDLALDLLAGVRRIDPRFSLFVRSVMPWDNPHFWRHEEEREFFGWCWERITHDPLLRGAVTFDPPGRDMARWYRRIGHILSTSDEESFHMAPAEGMASGAVPVIRPWPGAVEIYGIEWIHASTEDAVAAVVANADREAWVDRAARAQAEIRRTHDHRAVVDAWADLLHGDVAGARAHFAEYSGL